MSWASLPQILFFPKRLTPQHQVAKVRPPASRWSLCLCLFARLLLYLDVEPPKQHALQTNSWAHLKERCWVHICLPSSERFTSNPFVLVPVISPPPLSPACHSGKQAVQGHSRAPLMGPCCSLLRTRTCLWQCPIITPPSCGRSSPLPLGIPACWPPGVFPRPRHSADQISAAGHETAGFLWSHCRPQMPLQRNGCMYIHLA